MATPPTRVSYNVPTTGNYSSNTTPKTTPTFDVVSGDIIVVLAQAEDSATIASVTPSASGGTVTWTARAQYPAAVSGATSLTRCWTGAVGATATGITVSLASISAAADWWGFSATLVRAHGGVGQIFQGGIVAGNGAPSVAVACSANSLVLCAVNDWNAVDGTSRTWRTINGAAATETLYLRPSPTTHHTAYGGYRADTGTAATITQGLTLPSTMRWSLSGIEILGTSGGPATMTATVGDAAADGGTASLTGAALSTATVGDAPADGGTAALTGAAAMTATVGDAPADGGTASMTGAAVLAGTTGDAAADGGTGSLVAGGSAATMTGTTGDATADGGTASLTGAALMSSTAGNAPADGGSTSMTGAGTMTATVGDAPASGGSGSLVGGSGSTMTGTTGDASADGGTAALTATATMTGTTGTGTADGGTGALTVLATMTGTTGNAPAAGGTGAMAGAAVLAALVGDATAIGGTGMFIAGEITALPIDGVTLTVSAGTPRRGTVDSGPPRRLETT